MISLLILHKKRQIVLHFPSKLLLLAELKQLKKFPCPNFWPN